MSTSAAHMLLPLSVLTDRWLHMLESVQACPFISGLCHDKFSPCHGELGMLNVTSLYHVETQNHVERCYQFPCLTPSMTSECVFVICDM